MSGGVRTTAGPRKRGRVASGILSAQLLISGPLLVVIIALLFVSPSVYSSPVVFGMVFFFFALTAVSALVPWDSIPRLWGALLPFANLAGILVLREFDPQTGVGLLVVLPIIWIARTFGSTLTIAGVAGTILAMWGTRLLRGSPITWNDFVTFVVVPVLVGFVAGAIYVSSARGRAQAKLLRQHSSMVQVALEKASRQEGVLNELLNAVDFGVIAFDRTGTVTFVNRAQRQYLTDFGTPADAVVHPVIYQADGVTLYTEDDRPLNRALSGQAFDNLIIWVGEPGERRAAHSVSSRILHDREGEYDGGVIVLTDITKELEAVRARDDLIGSVSHELRSPLTSILGYLDLARDDDQLDEETRRMIDVAYANSERLLVIVTDLLRAASDADQQLAMSFTAGDVAQIARDSVEAHRVMAEEREVELVMDGADSAVAAIDPMRMRQVLDNLITNAIKYNREWGTVTVAVEPGAGGVSVEVRDTGQGIPEADLPRIFDRFYRTKSAKSSATVGTGLGLSITREIVHRHGGHLTVTSELGIGTTFRVTVPTERESSANAGARSVAA
ncbi:two-component sensor histidine kinase [Pseudolysinimonas yzui]|uniref:histidine kinase n=1 Tax=Pseudolysinimonas yzui TaxID=2708254 RepID=A0A8J3GP69_9MICO|nr:two-component sensor histidine kinase [Pseudolysinimonas yzui]